MRVSSTQLFIAFAVGMGCAVVLTFPTWSLGTVRSNSETAAHDMSVAKLNAPDRGDVEGPHLVIETTKHTLTVKAPGKSPIVMKTQGAYSLKRGSFTVGQKETNPLWQAPPTYFLRRGLQVPPEGSSSRAMRGALGRQALFLSKQVAIHSGPIWNEDVGGLKVSSEDMARLFDMVGVGATVEVL